MIYLDDNSVKVGGVILPGLYKKIEVSCAALVEEQEVKGSTKKPKQATGYEDIKIALDLVLLDGPSDTKEEKLRKIQSIFRGAGADKPIVHEFVSTLSNIAGVQQVICKSISMGESNKKEEYTVSLEFMEYAPIILQASKKGKKTGDTASNNLNEDYKNYLGSDRGSAPKQKNKTSQSPAVDKTADRM